MDRSAGRAPAAAAAALLVLAAGAAFAGPDGGQGAPRPGQVGAGPAVFAQDGALLAATSWDQAGLVVVDVESGAVDVASCEAGAGFRPVWLGGEVCFKEVVAGAGAGSEPLQRVVCLDTESWERDVLDEGPLLGNPSVARDAGLVVWTRGATVMGRREGETFPLVELEGYCNLAVPDPEGQLLAFDAADGRIGLLPLDGGEGPWWLTGPGAHARPEWSGDGRLLLLRGPGPRLAVHDAATGALLAEAEGLDPSFADEGHAVVFDRIETDGMGLVGADLAVLALPGGRVELLRGQDGWAERYPAAAPDARLVVFVDLWTGALLAAEVDPSETALGPARVLLEADQIPRPLDPTPPVPFDARVDVPYMHQLWDTPDDFNGGWSCGPTSCIQTVQRYGRLPDHDITASWPTPHTSPWGWYVPSEYEFDGYRYDILGLAAGDAWVPGAHGFICRELGAAYWAYMVSFMSQHGLTSWQAGSDFATLVAEVDAGFPMVASTTTLGYGHIMVFKGFGDDHSIVVNDPYGDANAGGWGDSRNGESAVYDWPGYNNGHVEIGVSQLFGAQGVVPPPDGDGDGDADAEPDGDADADGDGEPDGDAEPEADADADADADGDVAADADEDAPGAPDADGGPSGGMGGSCSCRAAGGRGAGPLRPLLAR